MSHTMEGDKPFLLPPPPKLLERARRFSDIEFRLEMDLYTAIKERDSNLEAELHEEAAMEEKKIEAILIFSKEKRMNHGILLEASCAGHLKVVKMIADTIDDINISYNKGFTALTYAAQAGHIDVVKELLKRGADPLIENSNGDSAITRAEKCGFLAIVKLLKER